MPECGEVEQERGALDLLMRGFQVSRMLRFVADLGVADRIAPDSRMALALMVRIHRRSETGSASPANQHAMIRFIELRLPWPRRR